MSDHLRERTERSERERERASARSEGVSADSWTTGAGGCDRSRVEAIGNKRGRREKEKLGVMGENKVGIGDEGKEKGNIFIKHFLT